MSFEKLMKDAQADRARSQKFNLSSDVLRGVEVAYLAEINKLIVQLNNCQDAERSEILKRIKETDKLFLSVKEIEITGHVLFTRHGKCAGWGQKKFGLSPNAAISEKAAKNMGASSESTGSLLFYSSSELPPYIAISPMNRPVQTAGLMIPKEIKNAVISIEPSLAESSSFPSGVDVRSKEDMQKLYDAISFWKSPLNKSLLKLSLWLYSDKDFEQRYLKRKQAAAQVEAHGNPILTSGDGGHSDIRQDLDYDGDKIKDIKALMRNAEQRDCWFFGHAETFKAFFKEVFGIKSDFEFAETRSVYKARSNEGAPSFFTPPYVMVINQNTGKIEGKYTATLALTHIKSEEEIPAVSTAMNKLGASASKELNEPVISAQKDLFAEPKVLSDHPLVEPSNVEKAETNTLLPKQ